MHPNTIVDTRNTRRSTLLKVLATVAVIGGGLGLLLYSTSGSAFEYYKHVDEVAGHRAAWQKKPLQLHGFVKPGSIQRRLDPDKQQMQYKFLATNCDAEVEVQYAGLVPDTFKDSAEVVVKGTFDGDKFHSTEIMAKCPSKYQMTAAPNVMCAKGQAN